MPDEPIKLFDLMDIENEPTDDQLAELMEYVAKEVRRKQIIGEGNPSSEQTREMASQLVERLISGE